MTIAARDILRLPLPHVFHGSDAKALKVGPSCA